MSRWPKEEVPDVDRLFMRVHRMWIRDGAVLPGAFKNRGAAGAAPLGMSTNWAKYSTAEATRKQAKDPAVPSVGSLDRAVSKPMRNFYLRSLRRSSDSIVFGMGERDEGVPVLLVQYGDLEVGARKAGCGTEPPPEDDR